MTEGKFGWCPERFIDNDKIEGEQVRAGLCFRCRHARVVESDRGSKFYLCQLSMIDPRFLKYPRLPVIECTGYVPKI
jgi:hypothetical protein